jgi:hypothetical protein
MKTPTSGDRTTDNIKKSKKPPFRSIAINPTNRQRTPYMAIASITHPPAR